MENPVDSCTTASEGDFLSHLAQYVNPIRAVRHNKEHAFDIFLSFILKKSGMFTDRQLHPRDDRNEIYCRTLLTDRVVCLMYKAEQSPLRRGF